MGGYPPKAVNLHIELVELIYTTLLKAMIYTKTIVKIIWCQNMFVIICVKYRTTTN